jgi:DNA excision repair protein ERCC-2
MDGRLGGLLSRYLESNAEIVSGDPVLRICSRWSDFTAALELALDPERTEFFITWAPNRAGGTVRITCCDASRMLEDTYDAYEQVIGFSATLKPFEYYAALSGLAPDNVRTAEFPSPFPKAMRKLLIIPQISTKFSDRNRNYAKIAEAVNRIASVRIGNYFVFLPSFEFMENVVRLFVPPSGVIVLKQERHMKQAAVDAVLDHLRAGEIPAIVFAVQGGSFSEGMDYAGEMVIGAFVVGPPLPTFDLEREEMRKYYQRRYNAGFEYAYSIPAMAKSIQAAGRVIRSETERGLVVLMDGRFIESGYARCMPDDWFENDVGELVSGSILREVEEFWSATDPAPEAR